MKNTELAQNLIGYSCSLKKGEKILIEGYGARSVPLVEALVKEVYKVGALPFVEYYSETTQRLLVMNAAEEQLNFMAELGVKRMKEMDAYIRISAADNVSEMSDVPAHKQELFSKLYTKPVHFEVRVPHTKWCVLRYPTPNMAQMAKKSTEEFAEFYYNVCNLDYSKMSKAMDGLVELMSKTDRVRIVGPDTDLSFSIKGIPVVKCDGKCNIPDGEVFTAPVKDSVNGVLTYNTPSDYHGFTFTSIRFEFENGKIVKATSNDNERINKILDTDEGARYIGEFAIGVNPYITTPMLDTLFDEKIMGSFHFTPGACYDDASNNNKSAVHWDLVNIQTDAFGGGEMYFDDVLVRKDGIFVLDELKSLNPENLK